MTRHDYSTKVIKYDDMNSLSKMIEIHPSPMTEDTNGRWVLHSEAQAEIDAARAENPLRRIEQLEQKLGLVYAGCCPECGRKTDGWRAPQGSFAPEAYATLKERDIDPGSGHKMSCKLRPRE